MLDLDLNGEGSAGTGFSASFTEGDIPVRIVDTDVSITDVDSAIASATITLRNPQDGDVLAINAAALALLAGGAITAVVGAGTITLTGSATEADYQAALQLITFANTSEDPVAGDRTIDIVVTDGEDDSNTATATIAVAAVNDAPVLDLDLNGEGSAGTGFSASFTEGDIPVRIVDTDVSITDVDSAIASATITLRNSQDGDVLAINAAALALLAGGAITAVVGAGTITLTGSATEADYQAALQLITFANTSEDPVAGDRTIDIVVTDGEDDSNTATATIAVAAVNDAPVLDLDLNGEGSAGRALARALRKGISRFGSWTRT